MKIEMIERCGQYFLRRRWLGFIPVYWDDDSDAGWWFFRYPISSKERAVELIEGWKALSERKSQYKKSKEVILRVIEFK